MQHRIKLTNGSVLLLTEDTNCLDISMEDDREGEGWWLGRITGDGILVAASSGGACSDLIDGLKGDTPCPNCEGNYLPCENCATNELPKQVLKVNGVEITAKQFAYEGCHKIYLINSEAEAEEAGANGSGYTLYPIEGLQQAYEDSCGLRFINKWDLSHVVGQFEDAVFEGFPSNADAE